MTRPRLLLLAGTAEARRLAEALAARGGVAVTAALAGRTAAPPVYPVPLRTGGFGGADGLARHLAETGTDLLVDATHPFAARISASAATAARRLGLPALRLERPAWTPRPADRWTEVPTLDAAARCLPKGARAFLAVGPGSAAPFLARRDVALILRSIEAWAPPSCAPQLRLVRGRPPFTLEEEIATFRSHAVTHLVAKNAGGAEGRAKLDAAAALGISVLLVARPAPAARPLPTLATVEEALAWVASQIAHPGGVTQP